MLFLPDISIIFFLNSLRQRLFNTFQVGVLHTQKNNTPKKKPTPINIHTHPFVTQKDYNEQEKIR